ncbi:monovalent cation:H+ antiporter, CPA1 (nhx1) [Orbilia oligospora]|nr:monovalent cation:H+ antiporter, CPA1 (nhx1) [Orbilia oligospora]KAF3244508.1 monovalent cation:H+ antiporter, CPA1 (nhx1) [Orbilia oligospora]KAF3268181.1 monovalent cation:H+ antiporter, CPA1 (nhx1) [Orbilia oligospora]KAF3295972.1 monovalent cation:H+ antiporter, CPA1 (nhx1) [Orbilia oligospora]
MGGAAEKLILDILRKRQEEEPDQNEGTSPGQSEISTSWALFILVALLLVALFTSYYLQLKKIQAVHETVISIFAGMFVGLIIRLSPATNIQNTVTFDQKFFFNLILPPIIMNSGYELHQANFFRNLGTILTFALAGTFLSAVTLGIILYVWAWLAISIEGLAVSFVDAIAVGATLSATDPVTILAIFNTYKVDPKLYTIIFGESILNDAVAIVMFETAQAFHEESAAAKVNPFSFIKGVGWFFMIFFFSLLIGILVGVGTALLLKYTYIRRFPKTETCFILLVAYGTYLFSTGIHASGIVSLLFCGITLKHYAYYNMSRRTQLATKYLFQALAQLAENFVFIYLGISLFTESHQVWNPLFIIVTSVGICAARWVAVFPLSKGINWVIRYRASRRGRNSSTVPDELPYAYQMMLFWAGLRGAVGVALASGFQGDNGNALRATVLVVVVLTVIVFGGTTAKMLEILGIRTGVVEEIDSDDEFDIQNSSSYWKYQNGGGRGERGGSGERGRGVPLANVDPSADRDGGRGNGSAFGRDARSVYGAGGSSGRTGSRRDLGKRSRDGSQVDLLYGHGGEEDGYDSDMSDLPPMAARRGSKASSPNNLATPVEGGSRNLSPRVGAGEGSSTTGGGGAMVNPVSALSQLVRGTVEDQAEWFRQLDEGYIKPHLLLDSSKGHDGGGPV